MDDLPSTQRSPRDDAVDEQTGTGAPRSGRGPVSEEREPERDQSINPTVVGGTTSSHPAETDDMAVNRSGSGGSGGPRSGEDSEGSAPASMDELLGGDPVSGDSSN